MRTLIDCQRDIARKHGIGNSLVTGHRVAYFNEAAELYAREVALAFITWADAERYSLDNITERIHTDDELYSIWIKRSKT